MSLVLSHCGCECHLYCRTAGVSGKMSTESASEDDNFGTENSQVAILAVLGRERRDRVLAGLYMGRSDTALLVRQAALHVWKVIVAHTPKMLREIMSTLFQLLLGCLASQSYDKRQVTRPLPRPHTLLLIHLLISAP